MTTSKKSKADLLAELDALRRRISALEARRKENDDVEVMMWETQVALATLIDNLPGIAYRTAYDENGKPHVAFVSAGCRVVAEQDTADFISDPHLYREVIVHPDDRERVRQTIDDAVAAHTPYDLTYRIRTPKGTEKWVCERGFGLYNEAGTLVAREGFISDISDRVKPLESARLECERLRDRLDEAQLEIRLLKARAGQHGEAPVALDSSQSQLMRSQRFEALGNLAGGIAHDFNNLLQAIIGYAKLAGEHKTHTERVQAYLTRILEASTRARQLVAQILTFCKHAEQEPAPHRLQDLIGEGMRMLRASLPATIELTTTMAGGRALIVVDPSRFSQVFIALCSDLLPHLLPDGGCLDITLTLTEPDAALPDGLNWKQADQFGVLSISAHPAAGTAHNTIATPVETLGMNVIRDIIRNQGGTIASTENPPWEYTHTLYLALATSADISGEDDTVVNSDAIPGGSGEHILFVDDEEMLVELGQLVAEDLGYRVTACTSSVDALHRFENSPQTFDLVITDQTMPRMTGFDLAGKMLAIRPDVPIILTTGYSEVVNELQARAIGIREYLMKPITPETLAEAIRRVLDHPPPP